MVVPLTTIEFLDRAVDIYGDETGVIADDGTKYTYRQFNERQATSKEEIIDFAANTWRTLSVRPVLSLDRAAQ